MHQPQRFQRVRDAAGEQRALDRQYRTIPRRVIDYGPAPKRATIEVLNLANRQNIVAYNSNLEGTATGPIGTFFGRRTVVLGFELR